MNHEPPFEPDALVRLLTAAEMTDRPPWTDPASFESCALAPPRAGWPRAVAPSHRCTRRQSAMLTPHGPRLRVWLTAPHWPARSRCRGHRATEPGVRAKGKGQSAESETPADRLGCSGRRRAAFGYFRAPVQRRAGASELQKAVSKRARHGAACGRRRKIEVGAWSSAGLRAACVPRSPTPVADALARLSAVRRTGRARVTCL